MAGDWLKMEVNLPEKPEVWQIAGILRIDPDAVVGKLLKVWRWFDAHTENGNANGVGFAVVDAAAGVVGFAEAMSLCGWLQQVGTSLQLPKFESHNGKTAKTRAETARRVAKHKAGKGNSEVTRCTLPRPLVAAVKLRDNATCVYCGRREGEYVPPETARDAAMCIDHVVPLSQGGGDDIENLVCACSACNLFKSDRTPEECGLPWPKDDSGNAFGNRSRVTSALPREEKRREEKKAPAATPGPDLPDWISTEAWEGFDAMRRKSRHPLTPRAAKLVVNELAKLRAAGHDPNAVLDQSTRNGWRDVFPLRDRQPVQPQQPAARLREL